MQLNSILYIGERGESGVDTAFLSEVLKAAAAGLAGEFGKQLLVEVRKRFSRKPDAAMILDNYQRKPDVWTAPLREALEESKIAEDPKIVALAERVYSRSICRNLRSVKPSSRRGVMLVQWLGETSTSIMPLATWIMA